MTTPVTFDATKGLPRTGLPSDEVARGDLLERLAGLARNDQFGQIVRRALHAGNYAHACAEYDATETVPCALCGGRTPDRVGGEWCLTDLIRLPEKQGLAIADAIAGLRQEGRAFVLDHRIQSTFGVRMRIVHADVVDLPMHVMAPGPDVVPTHGRDGVTSHDPSQWKDRVEVRFSGTFVLPVHHPRAQFSATHLLRKHGWMAMKGGNEAYRFSESNKSPFDRGKPRWVRHDAWRVVERAFEILHPSLAPAENLRWEAPCDAPDEELIQKAVGDKRPETNAALLEEVMAQHKAEMAAMRAEFTAALQAPRSHHGTAKKTTKKSARELAPAAPEADATNP